MTRHSLLVAAALALVAGPPGPGWSQGSEREVTPIRKKAPAPRAAEPRAEQPAAQGRPTATERPKIDPGVALRQLPRPDLSVEVIAPGHPDDSMRFFMRNTGQAAAGPFVAEISCEPSCEAGKLKGSCALDGTQLAISGLAAGAVDTRTVPSAQLPPWPMYYCHNVFGVKVDVNDDVAESNEGNNHDSVVVSGPSQP